MKAWNKFISQLSRSEIWYLAILLMIFVHNLFLPILEIDSMQYAGMAKEMSRTGRYLQVHEFGRDYLDKPPLLFWLSSISMKLFGVHYWSYRLPNFICLLLGLWGTYRFSLLFYSQRVAKDALFILASSMAFFQMLHDVRTDGLLMSFVILGIWKLSEYLIQPRWSHFIWTCFFVALAMLAKGPIGLLAVGIPIFLDLLMKRQWSRILDLRWLLAALVILLFLGPMLWGLYQQFDLHPEKEVYGLSGPSGIKFYFWTQSFGRITGDIYWDNNTPWYYFLETMIWDYSPWYILLIPAWIWAFAKIRHRKEYITVLGFTAVFLMMSASKFKLPHYIFVVFPLAAVLIANYVSLLSTPWKKNFSYFYLFLTSFLLAALWLIPTQFFPPLDLVFIGAWLLGLGMYFTALRLLHWDLLISRVAMAMVALALVLSFSFYPQVFDYQLNTQVAKIIREGYNSQAVYTYYHRRHAIDFEVDSEYNLRGIEELRSHHARYVLIHPSSTTDISREYRIDTIHTYTGYPISRLNLKFLYKKSRPSSLTDTLLLVHITEKEPQRD